MFRRTTDPKAPVTISIDGEEHTVQRGDSVAAALLCRDMVASYRRSPASGEFRAPYCLIGTCFECLVEVDGQSTRGCQAPVEEGMAVRRMSGARMVRA